MRPFNDPHSASTPAIAATPKAAVPAQPPARSNAPAQAAEAQGAQPRVQFLQERYRLCKTLGRGGFGITILAQDYNLPGRPYCVIKKLSPLIQEPEALAKATKRFQQEAKILGQLGGHAQVPLMLNYFEDRATFYLVQEFIHGETLTQSVKSQGVWSEAQVVKFWLDMLPVLSFIHEQGVIHRDIKPSNIMQSSFDKRPVLLDFGAVKSVLAAEETALQLTQKFVGTCGFAPPEQQQLRPCFASDFYALAMTSLFLLTGRWPQSFPWDKTRQRIQWRDAVAVSRPFQAFLTQQLDPNPFERLATVTDLQRSLMTLAKRIKASPDSPPLEAMVQPAQAAPLDDDLKACMHHHPPKRQLRRRA